MDHNVYISVVIYYEWLNIPSLESESYILL